MRFLRRILSAIRQGLPAASICYIHIQRFGSPSANCVIPFASRTPLPPSISSRTLREFSLAGDTPANRAEQSLSAGHWTRRRLGARVPRCKRPTGAVVIRLARQRGLGVRLRTAAARTGRAPSHCGSADWACAFALRQRGLATPPSGAPAAPLLQRSPKTVYL